MPDIYLCKNETCHLRETCCRYTLVPCNYKFYGSFQPDENGNCFNYIPIEKKNHTPNELFIIKLISSGHRVKDIAKLKERSIKTVEATLYTMRKKYLCRSVAQLVYKFSKEGLI